MEIKGISKRALSAKEKGRRGGLATARNSSEEFLEQRSTKGGMSTKERYGVDYFRFLQSLRKNRPRPTKERTDELLRKVIPLAGDIPSDSLNLMRMAVKSLA